MGKRFGKLVTWVLTFSTLAVLALLAQALASVHVGNWGLYMGTNNLSYPLQGHTPPIGIEYYGGWDSGSVPGFDVNNSKTAWTAGESPFAELQPCNASDTQAQCQTVFTAINNGTYDAGVKSFGTSIASNAASGQKAYLTFAHEMNATYYPWGFQNIPAATWVSAFNRVVSDLNSTCAGHCKYIWAANTNDNGSKTEDPIAGGYGTGVTSLINYTGEDCYYTSSTSTWANTCATTFSNIKRHFTSVNEWVSEAGVPNFLTATEQNTEIKNLLNSAATHVIYFDAHSWTFNDGGTVFIKCETGGGC